MNLSTDVFNQEYVFQRSIFAMGIHSVRLRMTRSSAILGHCCFAVVYLCFLFVYLWVFLLLSRDKIRPE